jgi:uncharacterized protein YycO
MVPISKPIALTPPKGGGLCLDVAALQPGDIVVSTTAGAVSTVIRLGTGSPVSHAALYVGGSEVVEALEAGVTRWSLSAALADDALAVVYRSAEATPAIAARIAAYAIAQVGQKYNAAAALVSSQKLVCMISKPAVGTFFCSQLVLEAYKQAGLPLTSLPSHCITPADTVAIATHKLKYIGHLKGRPAWLPVLSP